MENAIVRKENECSSCMYKAKREKESERWNERCVENDDDRARVSVKIDRDKQERRKLWKRGER